MNKDRKAILNGIECYYVDRLSMIIESLANCKVNNPIVIQRLKTEKRMIEMFLDDLNQIK
ncbi:MAG: hypothetical protein ACRC6E_06860 [Fusobacteriaceae bacterium]